VSSRPSLRSQLNQIRLWVRQGRTDAWIAHKLDISVEQLEQFKRDHQLDGEPPRPERESPRFEPEPEPEPEPPLEPEPEAEQPASDAGEPVPGEVPAEEAEEFPLEREREPFAEAGEGREGPRRRRRRGRRGGRRQGGRAASFEATFEHGGEGYGLWLDPAVAENEVYAEHWAGHRAVIVAIDRDEITIRRAEPGAGGQSRSE
jgi:hypothetical protein